MPGLPPGVAGLGPGPPGFLSPIRAAAPRAYDVREDGVLVVRMGGAGGAGGGDEEVVEVGPCGVLKARRGDLCDAELADLGVDRLRISEQIGEGRFGTVYCAEHRSSGRQFAVKAVPLGAGGDASPQEGDALRAELTRALSGDTHPNVVRAYAAYFASDSLHIVMELVDGGDLAAAIRRCGAAPLPALQQFAQQGACGLAHLHSLGVLHRDIKPQNILLTAAGGVKIGDFGIAASLGGGARALRHTIVGTKVYMSPERARGDEYGRAADVWSLGVVAAEAAQGRYPLADGRHDMRDAQVRLRDGEASVRWPDPPGQWGAPLRGFVAACCQQAPESRPTAGQLLGHELPAGAPPGTGEVEAWLRAAPSLAAASAAAAGGVGVLPPPPDSPLVFGSSGGSTPRASRRPEEDAEVTRALDELRPLGCDLPTLRRAVAWCVGDVQLARDMVRQHLAAEQSDSPSVPPREGTGSDAAVAALSQEFPDAAVDTVAEVLAMCDDDVGQARAMLRDHKTARTPPRTALGPRDPP